MQLGGIAATPALPLGIPVVGTTSRSIACAMPSVVAAPWDPSNA